MTDLINLIVQQLRSQGLLVTRASNAQMVDPEEFAKDIAAQWAMCDGGTRSELVDLMHSAVAGPHEATRADESMWRPADLTPLKQLRLAHGLDPNTGERK